MKKRIVTGRFIVPEINMPTGIDLYGEIPIDSGQTISILGNLFLIQDFGWIGEPTFEFMQDCFIPHYQARLIYLGIYSPRKELSLKMPHRKFSPGEEITRGCQAILIKESWICLQ